MIKKFKLLFSISLISCFILFGNFSVKAYDEVYDCAYYQSYSTNWWCYILSPGESFQLGNYTNKLTDFFNFDDLSNRKVFYMGRSDDHSYSAMFWNSGELYSVGNSNYIGYLGKLDKFCVYNGTDSAGIMNHCFLATTSDNYAHYTNDYYYYNVSLESVVSEFGGHNVSNYLFTNGWSSTTPTSNNDYVICGIYNDIQKTLCVRPINVESVATHTWREVYDVLGETDTHDSLTYLQYQGMYQSSPLGSGGGGSSGGGGTSVSYGTGATIIGSEESAIQYFEDYYGRDQNICYVGVDNVTTLYGTNGVSFQAGTGLSIFETFNAIYGNSDLNKVYVWLNTWLINYEQWFLRSGDPLYLANYNSGTNQVDIYYDNLTFPFSGKPVAYYFMADNIEGYNEPQGSEIVSYCNLKINNGTYDEIIDQSTKNNIDKYSEKSNINIGLNPDGTVKDRPDFGMFTGSAWVGSGVDVEFTGSTTLKNTLENFFNQVDNLFSNSVSSSVSETRGLRSQNSIIPGYIVTALMFVILFKFLRRR